MVLMLKKTLPLTAWNAGAAYQSLKARTHGLRLLVRMLWLSLSSGIWAESLQTETVDPDADAVSGSDASQETWYCGKKGLTHDPEGTTNLFLRRSAYSPLTLWAFGSNSLPKNTPSSKSNHMGTASSDWEITSGGVSSMPKTKQPMMM